LLTVRYTKSVITTLTGENDVLRQDALRQIVGSFVAQHTDVAVERLDGEETDYARMYEAVQSLPFLATRKLVVLRSPGANKEFVERFDQFIAAAAATSEIVLVEPKLDKRLAYYKQLKKWTDFQEFAQLDGVALVKYLVDYVKRQGGSLGANEARFLVDRVGTNQLMLRHELDKLVAYNPQITRTSIELLTDRSPQSSIFELLDAAFSRDVQRAMRLYDEQRDMRVEPQQIMAMLVWQLHILSIAKAAGSRSVDVIAKEARLSPFTVRKSVGLVRGISGTRLKRLVSELRAFDVRLKSESVSADEVVRYYLLSLAQG
jgi:DNA polymerase III subunit delta